MKRCARAEPGSESTFPTEAQTTNELQTGSETVPVQTGSETVLGERSLTPFSVRKAIAVDSALLALYAGRYQLPHRVVTVTYKDGRLYIDVPQDGRSELFAETPTEFFLKIRPWTLTFVQTGGRITRLDILEAGEIVTGKRIEYLAGGLKPAYAGTERRRRFKRT